MTLAAPKSRQGRFTLALTIVVALAAVVGGLLWYNSASANLPSTTVNLSQSPATGTTVNPGDTVTYTMTTTTVGANDNGAVIMRIVLGAGLDPLTSTVNCPTPAGGVAWVGAGAGTGTLTCTSGGVLTSGLAGYIMTVTADVAAASSSVAAPGTTDVRDTSNNPVAATRAGSVGTLDVAGVSVNPVTVDNLVGQAETFTWTLPAGYTCGSDADFSDTLRSCVLADVTLVAGTTGATITAGPTVSDTALGNLATVTVTINGTAAGTATVTLATKFQDDDVAFIETPDATGTKNYLTLADVGDAHLVHVDVDDSTEDVADDGVDDQVAGKADVGGVLTIQDDPDDATGSLHTACLLSAALGAGDNANIVWTITPTAGSQANAIFDVADGEVILNVDTGLLGDLDKTEHDDSAANCVQWRSGGVGGQTIQATYVPTGEVIGWDDDTSDSSESGIGDPPLIKQWNDIDVTSIINVTGNVGATLADNTLELDLDPSNDRDCTDSGFCARSNYDGTTVEVSGSEFTPFGDIWAGGKSFIDYTFGNHDNYDGPVDGVKQTYSVSGSCGSVRLEDPVDGTVIILTPGNAATILNSDKGVGFEVLPTDNGDVITDVNNADCQDGDSITVSISSREDVQLRSDLDTAPDEDVTVRWVHGPGANKQPQLAWAGQRVVLEHDWSQPDGTCLWTDVPPELVSVGVRYAIQHPSPGFLSPVPLSPAIATGPDYLIVPINDDCISRVIYESQEFGEVDVTAHVVAFDFSLQDGGTAPLAAQVDGLGLDPSLIVVLSEEYDFLVYYMKLEDVQLEASDTESIVSSDVELTATVRGWTLLNGGANCPAANVAGVDQNGGVLPAGRCIFPDDWRFLAGGDLAMISNPNMDIYGGSGGNCQNRAGPFSLLDGPACGDSMAPHADGGFREANWPNGVIDENDAPMPPAEILFAIDMFNSGSNDSGFLRYDGAADKATSSTEAWDRANIPAEPWILTAGSGYRWDSFGGGANNGTYRFWEVTDHSAEVISCAGPSNGALEDGNPATEPCPGDAVPGSGVNTGGAKSVYVYSDNHGVAKALINGDADLTFDDCTNTASGAGHQIVDVNGWYCEQGDVVGTSEVDVIANYPDKQGKHYPLSDDAVTITWLWDGIKEVTIEATDQPQFNYVVFHVTDRDGFCGDSDSLHPVLGESVYFQIDSGDGIIWEAAAFPWAMDDNSVWTETFSANANPDIAQAYFVSSGDECQAWILVNNSLLTETNVTVIAEDPEGTITFDTVINADGDNDDVRDTVDNCPGVFNPDQADNNGFEDGTGAGDACEVIPTPTPDTATDLWGDVDCDGDVDSVDALKVLQTVAGLPISQTGPCHAMGDSITVDGAAQMFGDWDCDGTVTSADALAILRFIVSDPLAPGGGCPVVGTLVDIS